MSRKISSSWPVWYDPSAPLGSAVRYVASLSPRFNWVGIYELKGKSLVLGPYVGAATEHTRIAVAQSELVILVRDSNGEIVGQIDIDSHTREAFSENDPAVRTVRRVAKELGELWPA